MSDTRRGNVRKVQPEPLSQAQSLPGEEWPTLIVSTSADLLESVNRKRTELILMLADMGVFFGLCSLMLSFISMSGSVIHEGYFMTLNLALAGGFALSSRYFDLSESRHSLGKALLLAFSLTVMNAFALTLVGEVNLYAILGCAAVFALNAAVSGPVHSILGKPFSQQNSDGFYHQVEKSIKRFVDLSSSMLGLLFLSPLLALVTLTICLESKGSPLYQQTRIGIREKQFSMYKFRSMITDAENIELARLQVLYKRDDDPRITRFGRIIRKLSIDELPQLWNVVVGDMSLVGPRPPIEREYELMNWYHKRKFEAKPGLTGLWQITGRVKNERDFNSVATYDISYIENWSLTEDIRILLATIPVVLFQKGAC